MLLCLCIYLFFIYLFYVFVFIMCFFRFLYDETLSRRSTETFTLSNNDVSYVILKEGVSIGV
jgi:hypothetical protein